MQGVIVVALRCFKSLAWWECMMEGKPIHEQASLRSRVAMFMSVLKPCFQAEDGQWPAAIHRSFHGQWFWLHGSSGGAGNIIFFHTSRQVFWYSVGVYHSCQACIVKPHTQTKWSLKAIWFYAISLQVICFIIWISFLPQCACQKVYLPVICMKHV